MKTALFTALIATTLVLSGCGYKLGEIRPTPMRSVRTLSVPNFKNKTYEPRLEALFADTLVKRLQQDGTYQIVNSNQADAILNCTITKIENRALRSVQNNVLATSEFGITADIEYEITDQSTGAVLLRGQTTGRSSYFSGNDLNTTQRQALSNVAADAANNLAVIVTEGW